MYVKHATKVVWNMERENLQILWVYRRHSKRMPNLHVGILKCMKERLRHLANQLSIKCFKMEWTIFWRSLFLKLLFTGKISQLSFTGVVWNLGGILKWALFSKREHIKKVDLFWNYMPGQFLRLISKIKIKRLSIWRLVSIVLFRIHCVLKQNN